MPEGQPTSIAYYHDIDLAKNQLLNAKLHPIETAQRTAMASTLNNMDEGLTVYDINLDTFFVWDGNQWLQVGLTQVQIQQIQEAYNRSVMAVDVTSTTTDRTVTLTYRDNTTIADSFKYTHVHNQSIASLEWTITHNLGKFPSVTIVDSSNAEVIGEVEFVDSNTLKVKFSAAFSGKAYIN